MSVQFFFHSLVEASSNYIITGLEYVRDGRSDSCINMDIIMITEAVGDTLNMVTFKKK